MMSETSSTKVLSSSADAMISALDRMIGRAPSKDVETILRSVRNEIAKKTSFSIELQTSLASVEQRVTIYEVTLFNADGTWHEAFGSREQLAAFLTGLRACCGMFQMYMPEIDIPNVSD